MNHSGHYERRTDRTVNEDQAPTSVADTSPFAIHGDPSHSRTPPPTAPQSTQRSIAWVRPSELPTAVGTPWVRRGIDLQAELTRRTRRAPASATARAGRRITRSAVSQPEPTRSTSEGLAL